MAAVVALTALCLSAGANALIDFQPCPELNAEITTINGVEGTPFECATLAVPLDYTNPESEDLELDLFRVPATEEPVLGSVLINFGGPGGTGAEGLPAWAEQAQSVIGAQWNLVSWDPRGTGFTIPFNCSLEAMLGTTVPTNTKRQVGDLVSVNLTEIFLNGGWETAGQIADFCATQNNETATLIGTAFVARDMIEIVDAFEEDGLLRYYGWSYGSALGAYVAALFPERIERVVLDANVNPHHYQAGHYLTLADNVDEGFAGFIESCFNATDDCALYSLLQPSTAQDILDSINTALAPFAQNATSGIEGYLTYLALKNSLYTPIYFPNLWPGFAETLAGLLNGTMPPPPPPVSAYGEANQAVIGIRASDATFIANSSDEYLPIVQAQSTVSPGFSDSAYFGLWPSARWSMPAKERYFGNFDVQTKSPILFVNGMFDPITPLVDAQNATATFQGRLLTHGGYGHGIFVAPSQCVSDYVQAYFLNGTLPEEGTFCEPDTPVVEIFTAAAQAGNGGSASDDSDSADSSTDDEGSADESSPAEDAAVRLGHGAMLALATVLAVVALVA